MQNICSTLNGLRQGIKHKACGPKPTHQGVQAGTGEFGKCENDTEDINCDFLKKGIFF